MKINNEDIFLAYEPLRQLMTLKWPVKVSYLLAKLSNKFDSEYKVITGVRDGLIRKHGTEKTKGRGDFSIKQDDEGWNKFYEEFNELMKNEVEIVMDVIKLPEEVDGKKMMVEPDILKPLMKFIEVE